VERKIKVKGFIDEGESKESYVTVPTQDFLTALAKLRTWFNA